MNGRERFVLTFAAAYAVAYYLAVYYNLALFSYGPAVGEWTLFNRPASAGPTMFWYGWLATAAIIAALVGLLACMLPQRTASRLWRARMAGALVFDRCDRLSSARLRDALSVVAWLACNSPRSL